MNLFEKGITYEQNQKELGIRTREHARIIRKELGLEKRSQGKNIDQEIWKERGLRLNIYG